MVKTLFHVTTLIGTMVLSKISQGLVMGGSNPDSEQEMLDAWGTEGDGSHCYQNRKEG